MAEKIDREKFKETPVRSREEWKEVLAKNKEPEAVEIKPAPEPKQSYARRLVASAGSAVQKMKEGNTMKNIRESYKERKRIEIRKAFGLKSSGGAKEPRAPSRPQIIVVGGTGARQRYAPQVQKREPEHGGIMAGGFRGGMLGGSESRDSGSGEIGMFAGPPKSKKRKSGQGLAGSW